MLNLNAARDKIKALGQQVADLQQRNSDLILCISKAYMLAPDGEAKKILEEYAEIITDESK